MANPAGRGDMGEVPLPLEESTYQVSFLIDLRASVLRLCALVVREGVDRKWNKHVRDPDRPVLSLHLRERKIVFVMRKQSEPPQ